MMKLLLRIVLLAVSNAVALWIASRLIDGFTFTQTSWQTFFWVGLVLGLVNGFIGPIIKLVTLPLRLLTLGLFTVIINLGLLFLVDKLFDSFMIETIWAGLWGLVEISLVNYLITSLAEEIEK